MGLNESIPRWAWPVLHRGLSEQTAEWCLLTLEIYYFINQSFKKTNCSDFCIAGKREAFLLVATSFTKLQQGGISYGWIIYLHIITVSRVFVTRTTLNLTSFWPGVLSGPSYRCGNRAKFVAVFPSKHILRCGGEPCVSGWKNPSFTTFLVDENEKFSFQVFSENWWRFLFAKT